MTRGGAKASGSGAATDESCHVPSDLVHRLLRAQRRWRGGNSVFPEASSQPRALRAARLRSAPFCCADVRVRPQMSQADREERFFKSHAGHTHPSSAVKNVSWSVSSSSGWVSSAERYRADNPESRRSLRTMHVEKQQHTRQLSTARKRHASSSCGSSFAVPAPLSSSSPEFAAAAANTADDTFILSSLLPSFFPGPGRTQSCPC
mmetsp:Transcript_24406/g.78835  ORF Transcript_24406/g.78835 Transcript_24406/m.78835 type:complete len:205 (+) Transcript_24406:396-1010(+)